MKNYTEFTLKDLKTEETLSAFSKKAIKAFDDLILDFTKIKKKMVKNDKYISEWGYKHIVSSDNIERMIDKLTEGKQDIIRMTEKGLVKK